MQLFISCDLKKNVHVFSIWLLFTSFVQRHYDFTSSLPQVNCGK